MNSTVSFYSDNTYTSSDSSVSSSTSASSTVRFGLVEVREYERILADSPQIGTDYASFAIGWRYHVHESIPVDEFKEDPALFAASSTSTTISTSSTSSEPPRKFKAMERLELLQESYGFSHEEVQEAARSRREQIEEQKQKGSSKKGRRRPRPGKFLSKVFHRS